MRYKLFFGALFGVFFSLFLVNNTNAASVATSSFDINAVYSPNGNYSFTNGLLYGQKLDIFSAKQYQFTTASITPTGNYAALHFETNIVGESFSYNYINFVNLQQQYVYACSTSLGGSLNIQSSSLSFAITDWYNNNVPSRTLTIYGDIVLSGLSQQSQQIVCGIGSSNYAFFTSDLYNSSKVYFERNPMSILYTNNASDSLLQTTMNQNNTIINNNQEYYDANYDAVDNIDNQSASDIQNATSQQTTSIIGTITSFVGALSNVQAGSCELTLPFPNFVGGNTNVNPCNGKDKAPSMITVGSSLLLIGFFIPFAFITLRMIFNEIRSFTNG